MRVGGRPRRLRGKFADFLTSTRAAATALTSAMLTMAALMGIGLVGDHLTLVGQRDLLKSAANAATVAVVKHLSAMNLNGVDDAQLDAILRPIATRYVLANIPADLRPRARATLEIAVTPDRAARTAVVAARADLGGVTFLDPLLELGDFEVAVQSGAYSDGSNTEVVLAIDVTGSMKLTLDGRYQSVLPDRANYPPGEHPDLKINIVKAAAQELVGLLNAGGGGAAIGIVPWDQMVRLGPDERARWVREGWVRQPLDRTYPRPYFFAPPGGVTTTLPPVPDREPWVGCLDQRSFTGTPPPASSAAPPWDSPFSMRFYSHEHMSGHGPSVGAFYCQRFGQNFCYERTGYTAVRVLRPQFPCRLEGTNSSGSPGYIVPLTTDTDRLTDAIDRLDPAGRSTYSALGLLWGMRLLAPSWRPVWGDATLPRDPQADGQAPVEKVIILLTDGEDNYVFPPNINGRFAAVCNAVKQAGIRVFIIAAAKLSNVNNAAFIRRLEACSSNADHPGIQHVFVNNATPDELRDAFRTVASAVRRIRMVY